MYQKAVGMKLKSLFDILFVSIMRTEISFKTKKIGDIS